MGFWSKVLFGVLAFLLFLSLIEAWVYFSEFWPQVPAAAAGFVIASLASAAGLLVWWQTRSVRRSRLTSALLMVATLAGAAGVLATALVIGVALGDALIEL